MNNYLIAILNQDSDWTTVKEMTVAFSTSVSQVPVVVEMGYNIVTSVSKIPVIPEMIYNLIIGAPATTFSYTGLLVSGTNVQDYASAKAIIYGSF